MFFKIVYGANYYNLSQIPITRVLQRIDIPDSTYQEGMGIVHYEPNQIKPPQSQSDPELVYVLDGSLCYITNNAFKKIFKKGQSFKIIPGLQHYTKAGSNGATIVATWVFNKKVQFVTRVYNSKDLNNES